MNQKCQFLIVSCILPRVLFTFTRITTGPPSLAISMLKAWKEQQVSGVPSSNLQHNRACSIPPLSKSIVQIPGGNNRSHPNAGGSLVESPSPAITPVPVSTAMGNAPSSSSGISCASGVESTKSGKLTTDTSQEELDRYAMTQEFLLQTKSLEEASQVSKLSHSDSIEPLDGLAPGSRIVSRSSSNVSNEKNRSFLRFRRNGPKLLDKIATAFQAAGTAVANKVNGMENLVFPHTSHKGNNYSTGSKPPTLSVVPRVPGGVLLWGCMDDEEHKQVVRQYITVMKELRGEEGLKAIGLEYRTVPIDVEFSVVSESRNLNPKDEKESTSTQSEEDQYQTMTRLFHTESNTMITMKNRKEFIADGDMYDQVARLCQEYAQEIMIEEGGLEWVTVSEAGNNPEPIRALVSSALSKDDAIMDKMPTLLIATGKGKVRAGIFSRQHLLTSGVECSTAISIIREANKRKMNVIMLDPNAHGERMGMVTFEKSMARIFRRWESCDDSDVSSDRPPLARKDLYVLSHSQSGAQFARYLLEKSSHYVPHIRAVAFTDSTHNIQWARNNEDLHQLLQSDNCVYFKCSKESSKEGLKPLKTTGEVVDTDPFWEHRFGRIKTRCAGTTEHSLTNWFARHHIWEHFDQFMHSHHSKKDQIPLNCQECK